MPSTYAISFSMAISLIRESGAKQFQVPDALRCCAKHSRAVAPRWTPSEKYANISAIILKGFKGVFSRHI
jgi:hypothetical protein